MKKFDLEAAKRGAAVCTRSGFSARIICTDRITPTECCVVALVAKNNEEHVWVYKSSGYFNDGVESNNDLMMRDDDYREKLERGKYRNGIVDINEMDKSSTDQDFITVREYWRRVYAGQAMQGIVSALDMNTSYAEDGVASMACDFADALIEELDSRNIK